MTQNEERKYASLMVKAYEWLMEFQKNHKEFTFYFKSRAAEHLFCGRGTGPTPRKNRFQVNIRPESKRPRHWFSLDFYADSEFTRISEVKLQVAYGSEEGVSRPSYMKFIKEELNGSDSLTPEIGIAGPSMGHISEDDVKDGLLSWLDKHYDALIEALKDDPLSPTTFEEGRSKCIKALCEKGVLQENDGRLSIPADAQFTLQGEADEETDGIDINVLNMEYDIAKSFLTNPCQPDNNTVTFVKFGQSKRGDSYKVGSVRVGFAFANKKTLSIGLYVYCETSLNKYTSREEIVLKIKELYTDDDFELSFNGSTGSGAIAICKKGVDSLERAYEDIVTPGNGSESWRKMFDAIIEGVKETSGLEVQWCNGAEEVKDPNAEFKSDLVVDTNIGPRNRIVFGAPGTGKSYMLNVEACRHKENGQDRPGKFESANGMVCRYERVTFYPTYSYAQFVGTYKPVMEQKTNGAVGEEEISYKFVPGPFLRVLVNALNEEPDAEGRKKNWCLIIEEINRANAAAVFGDVFQLLDRGSNGVSEYFIAASEDVRKYLKDKIKAKHGKKFLNVIKVDKSGNEVEDWNLCSLRIPDNMYIWATMNSADQGVFPMDTAFKRRWEFEYIGVDEEADADKKKGEDARCTKWTIDGVNYKWDKVRRVINGLLSANGVNEDKLMGPYFIQPATKEETSITLGAFSSKVLMYLWEDAGRMIRRNLFGDKIGTYSEFVEKWKNDGINVFDAAAKKDQLKKEIKDILDELIQPPSGESSKNGEPPKNETPDTLSPRG